MNTTEKGYCLVSQQIRDKISEGGIIIPGNISLDDSQRFSDQGLEKRVQPSSFEPVIGDEIFIIDTEDPGAFRPQEDETVYKSILKLPKRKRQRINITQGFEIKSDFTYLAKLECKVKISKEESIKSSPKSSIGRLFPVTRMIADYNPAFDNVCFAGKRELEQWLLIQPSIFNLVIYPGDTLNQLRFFHGKDVSLSQSEIIEEFNKNPLLCDEEGLPLRSPESLVTNDGLIVSFDLTGRKTEGIIALRARKNPNPIEIRRENFYVAEDYFEPVKARDGLIKLRKGEAYLIPSMGVLHIPTHLSAELRRHYGIGLRGDWDEAGFIDNSFTGDLVSEARPAENGVLREGEIVPFSTLEFFRTNQIPDKIYGKSIGSHYDGQSGPKVSKVFKPFDLGMAARLYKKLDKNVIVCDTRLLMNQRVIEEGFEPIRREEGIKLIDLIQKERIAHSRYDCEEDEEVLQPIPYVLLFNGQGKVFTYVRAKNIVDYGDERLFGKFSIGLGGHITKEDASEYVENCFRRELEEEVKIKSQYRKPSLVGTLFVRDNPVDRIHFGLIYTAHVHSRIKANESSITSCGMKSFSELEKISDRFETWSRVLIPHLPALYRA